MHPALYIYLRSTNYRARLLTFESSHDSTFGKSLLSLIAERTWFGGYQCVSTNPPDSAKQKK